MSHELQPCPFCGSVASLIDRENGPFIKGAFVTCDNCNASMSIFDTAVEAVHAWNCREASPTQIAGEPTARQPLSDEQIYQMYSEPSSDAEMLEFAREIERAHGIGAKP